MTADFRMTSDDEQPPDLSDAFGRSATASLRGLLPPRPRRSSEQDEDEGTEGPGTGSPEIPAQAMRRGAVVPLTVRTSAPDEVTESETESETPTGVAPAPPPADVPPAPRGARRPAPTSGSTAGTANRRWGSVRLASQEHVELLVLVTLRRGPASGRELAERLRADSGGGLAPPPTTIQKTLHHLARHGLVELGADTERRRYRLTELGMRIARARVRAWRSLRRTVDRVLDAADEG
ncbi:PadR family transcriptional regulator [Actinomycetospora callitridis]|uniref:PadR family transcriptional regulator n=1 Tax=Actinomycetospora callitridis TaxID=913944 RepID=UPI0023655A00|nr:PadR family transcriptional regulator [Actinomycetospora callitridis]MDD7920540.1 PadR family transcriptional regulator [Actinomycetospora callitridis]